LGQKDYAMLYRRQFGQNISAHVPESQDINDGCAVFERPDDAPPGTEQDKLIAVVKDNETASSLIGSLISDERPTILTCVYCGEAYPPGTPASQHQMLFDHIKTCPKHPLGKAVRVVQMLYARLLQIDTEMPHGASLAAVDFLESLKAPAQPQSDVPFTLNEIGNTYVHRTDQFVVSLMVGYCPHGDGIKTPQEAVAAALRLVKGSDADDTNWYCFDRNTEQLHLIRQQEVEDLN
jgi:hypothetical protein